MRAETAPQEPKGQAGYYHQKGDPDVQTIEIKVRNQILCHETITIFFANLNRSWENRLCEADFSN